MKICEAQANELCEKIIYSLLNWPVLKHALQSGGVERKAQGVIAEALEKFISGVDSGKYILPEYRCIDFSVVDSVTGGAYLNVDTVFEVKTNYAAQLREINTRLPSSLDQVREYSKLVSAENAYVIYIIFAPFQEPLPPRIHRDIGWGYWNQPLNRAIDVIDQLVQKEPIKILGHFASGDLYCALFDGSN